MKITVKTYFSMPANPIVLTDTPPLKPIDNKTYKVTAEPIESGISRSDFLQDAKMPNMKNNTAGDRMLLKAISIEFNLMSSYQMCGVKSFENKKTD